MHKVLPSLFLALSLVARGQTPAPAPPDAAPATGKASVAGVRGELEGMFDTDQLTRLQIVEIEKRLGPDSAEEKAAWARQGAIDAPNIRRLEEIVAEYGWPGTTRFCRKATEAAFLILQHSDITNQEKYLPLARAATAKGEMGPSALALLEDRVHLREGHKQLYGSQVTRNGADEWEPLPLEDERKVDALRAAVGLGPIADYLQGFADRVGGRVSPKWAKKTSMKPGPAAPATIPTSQGPR